jgi:hypothetical protein
MPFPLKKAYRPHAQRLQRYEECQRIMREQYEAVCAMRNDINELIGNMPSPEATLRKGPELSHECEDIVLAIAAYVHKRPGEGTAQTSSTQG